MKQIVVFTCCVNITVVAIIPTSTHAQQKEPGRLVAAESQASGSDDDSRVSRNARRRWSSFSSEGLRKRLSSPQTKVRNLALRDINRRYYDHPEIPDLLVQAVTGDIAADEVSETTLTVVRMLSQYNETPRVREAFVTWLGVELQRDQARPLTFAILSAMRKFDDDSVHRAVEPFLDRVDPRVVMLAADVLGAHQYQPSLQKLTTVANHNTFSRQFGFRSCVIEAVSHFDNVESVDFMVSQLPRVDGQLKYLAVDHLTRVTGKEFAGDARAWIAWWNKAKDGYNVPQKATASPDQYAWEYPLPKFYTNAIYAKRIAFVIDHSSSMRNPVSPSERRLDRAKRELVAAISALPADAHFCTIVFDRRLGVQPVIQATPNMKQQAISRVASLGIGEGTNIMEALLTAIAIAPDLEAIYFLSDGQPSVGVTDTRTILETVTRENQFRRISINCITVGNDNQLMRDLARRNRGSYRASR